jgi:hypothetical protein
MSGEIKTGSGSPISAVVPDFSGQIYVRTSDNNIFMAYGLNATDWVGIGNNVLSVALDAGSQKIHNVGRLDFISLGAEPGDATEGMLAYSDGTASTNGFGQVGEGVYYYDDTSWISLSVTNILDGTVALSKLANMATSRVLGRNTAGSGPPEALDEATFKTMFNLETGIDVQAWNTNLDGWAGKAVPAGVIVGESATQTLTNKTLTQPLLTLEQDTAPTPTDEGRIMWDTNDDRMAIGTGAATLLFSDDTVLKNRANHTGSQLMSTISDAGALATKATVSDAEIDANAIITAKILDGNVTLPKLANIADDTILGNVTGGAAAPAALTATQARTLLNVADGATANAGALADLNTVGTSEIDNDAVTLPKLQNLAANSILGNNTGIGADAIELTAAQVKALLAISNSDVSGLGALALLATVGASEIDDNSISVAKLAGGTAGDIIIFDASGDPQLLGAGANGYYLQSNGPGSAAAWAAVAGGGDVTKVGTPVNNQLGVWTGDGTIEGDAALTFDTATDLLAIGASGGLAFGAVTILSDAAGTTTLQNIDAIDATTEATLEAAIDALSNLVTVGTIGTGVWQGTAIDQAYLVGQSGTNTGDEAAASDTTAGVVELATIAETNTGTDPNRALTPDGLAGSDFGISYVSLWCTAFADDTAVGDGAAYFHVPPALDGMNLVYVHGEVITAGTTGTTDVQVHNVDNVLDMLSTKLTIDSAETGSDTAATAAVINASNDHINTNDMLRVDVDAVSTTAAKGLLVTLGFRKP